MDGLDANTSAGEFAHVSLLFGRCIFCLRSTAKGGKDKRESELKLSKDAQECLLVVQEAKKASLLPLTLLKTLNQIWGSLQKTTNGAVDDPIRESGFSRTKNSEVFPCLPKMCSFCAKKLVSVDKLLKGLLAEIKNLRKLMIDSKHGGKYSWRSEEFERVLMNSNLEQESILAARTFLGYGQNKDAVNYTDVSSTKTKHVQQTQKPAHFLKNVSMYEDDNGNEDDNIGSDGVKLEYKYDTIFSDVGHDECEIPCNDLVATSIVTQNSVQDPLQLTDYDAMPTASTSVAVPDPLGNSNSNLYKENCDDSDDDKQEKVTQNYTISERDTDDSDSDYIKSEEDDSSDSQDDEDYDVVVKTEGKDELESRSKIKKLDRPRYASPTPGTQTMNTKHTKSDEDVLPEYSTFKYEIDPKTDILTFTCLIDGCGKSYTESREVSTTLQRHQKKFHQFYSNESANCDYCSNKFKSPVSLIIHNVTKHSKNKRKRKQVQHLTHGRPVSCDLCKAVFPMKDLYEHVRAHIGDDYIIKCPNPKCTFACSQSVNLKKHISDKAACKNSIPDVHRFLKLSYTCEHCEFTAKNAHKIRSHLLKEHETSIKNFSCPITDCPQHFTAKQSVRFHLPYHDFYSDAAGIIELECEHCTRKIKPEAMEEHLKRMHSVQEIFRCSKCSFVVSTRELLVDHTFRHRYGDMTCDICNDGVKFPRHFELREHYFKLHQIGKRLICEHCDTSFWSLSNLNEHVRRRHQKKKRKLEEKEAGMTTFKCDECDKVVKSKQSLDHHNIRVHGAKPFSCTFCTETFTQFNVFKKHEKEHKGIHVPEPCKEFKCEVEGCGKIFSKKSNLISHNEFVHLGIKKNVCDICGKGFAQPQGLQYHKDSVHLGLRPFVCESCGESFCSENILRRHMLIHTGEKPFTCEICGQKFRHGSVLQRHLEGHAKKGSAFKPNGPMKNTRKRVERKNKLPE